jgi:hypothetical protein
MAAEISRKIFYLRWPLFPRKRALTGVRKKSWWQRQRGQVVGMLSAKKKADTGWRANKLASRIIKEAGLDG